MLKKRIIPIQLLMNDHLVKSKQFTDFRNVGDPVKSSSVYNSQYADELILLNIDRNSTDIEKLAKYIKRIAEVCFMPLSIGGGIRSFEDAQFLIKNGADKVVINSLAYTRPEILKKIADNYGTQALIVGIDVRQNGAEYKLYSHCGIRHEPVDLLEHIKNCIANGAGEIFIQSIDNDGMTQGYDINLIKFVHDNVDVPVIAAGGSGNYEHLKEVFLKTDVSAVACGSLFNFSDSNPIRAKAFLRNYDIPFKEV
jgi:cyclase